MPQVIQIKRGATIPAAAAVVDGELALRKTAAGELYAGDGTGVLTLVSPARQVEIAGAQTITGAKTVDVANLKVTGGVVNQFLQTTDPVTGALQFAAVAAPVMATDPDMDVLAPSTTLYTSPQNVRALVGGQLASFTTVVKTGIIPAVNSLKAEVDLIAIGSIFVGTFNATTGVATFTAASGGTSGASLPAAAAANKGWYLICDTAGAVPPANAPAGTYAPADWVISDGTAWTHLDFSSAAGAVTASNVSVTPAVMGATDVQAALEALDAANLAQDAAAALTYEPIITGTTAVDLWTGAKTFVPATGLPLTTAQIAIDAAQDIVIAGKEPALPAGGLVTQYLNGLKAWAALPAAGEPIITAGAVTDVWQGDKVWVPKIGLPLTTLQIAVDAAQDIVIAGKEPAIAAGNPLFVWYGDKTWKALPAGSAPPVADGISIVGDGSAATPFAVNIVDGGTY